MVLDDNIVEKLLEEKILEGYTLLDEACPSCRYPVVQLEEDSRDEEGNENESERSSRIIPFVPYCVACKAHVAFHDKHLTFLKESPVGSRGTMLLALPTSPLKNGENFPFKSAKPNRKSNKEDAPPADQAYSKSVDAPESRSLGSANIEVIDDEIEATVAPPVSPLKSMLNAFQGFFSTNNANKEKVKSTYDEEDTRDEIATLDGNPVREIHFSGSSTVEDELTVDHEVAATVFRKREDAVQTTSPSDFAERREIGTKVISKKLNEGYFLLPKICNQCELPQMEKDGHVLCVVCPILKEKSRKVQDGVKREADGKLLKASVVKSLIDDATAYTGDDSTIEKKTKANELEKGHAQNQDTLVRKTKILVAEERHLLEEIRKADMARERSNQATRDILTAEKNLERKEMELMEAIQRENNKIKSEARRLAELEALRSERARNPGEGMLADLSAQEQRDIFKEEMKLKNEIEEAKRARDEAAIEAKRLSDEKKALEEASLLQSLEDQATKARLEAEEAMARAQRAMDDVSYAQRSILKKTIAEADASLIAEVENLNRLQAEDYVEAPKLQTPEEVQRERWETLRVEGRSIMNRRMLAGWILLPELCSGNECHNCPLLSKSGTTYCVVCGGSGNGLDGAYKEELTKELNAEYKLPSIGRLSYNPLLPSSLSTTLPTSSHTDQSSIQTDKPTSQREDVRKEISKKILQGFKLLDMTCPTCEMPLLTDMNNKSEHCVLCGTVPVVAPVSHSFTEAKSSRDHEGEHSDDKSNYENQNDDKHTEDKNDDHDQENIPGVVVKQSNGLGGDRGSLLRNEKDEAAAKNEGPLENSTDQANNAGFPSVQEMAYQNPYTHILAASSRDTKLGSDPPALKGNPFRNHKATDVEGICATQHKHILPPRPDTVNRARARPARPQTGRSDDGDSALGLFVPPNFSLNDEGSLVELIGNVRAWNEKIEKKRISPRRSHRLPSPGMTAVDPTTGMLYLRGQEPPERRRSTKTRSPRDMTGSRKCVIYGGPVGMSESLSFEDGSVNTEAIDKLLYKIEKTKLELLNKKCTAGSSRMTKLLSNLRSAAEAMQRYDSRVCGYEHVSETK